MDAKFKRRVEQLINTLQFENVVHKPVKPKEELLSKFEQILDEKLVSFFSSDEIQKKLQKNKTQINEMTYKLELCDELQVPIPYYWTKIDKESKTIVEIETNEKIENLDDLMSKIPLERKERWKINMQKETLFQKFLYNELRYYMLTNNFQVTNYILEYCIHQTEEESEILFFNLWKAINYSKRLNFEKAKVILQKITESKNLSKYSFLEKQTKIMIQLVNFMLGELVFEDPQEGVYSTYLQALIYYHSEDYHESRKLCEKCLKLMKNLERVRIQPFLLYAKVLSNIYEYNIAENIYIEVLTLFPYCADGFMEYGKFLYQFEKRELESIDKLKKSLNCVDCSFIHINTYLTSIQENSIELSKEVDQILRDFSGILMMKFGISFKHDNIKGVFDISIEKTEKLENKKFKYNVKHPIEISIIFSLLGRFLGLNLGQFNKATTCYYYGFLLEYFCVSEALMKGSEKLNELFFFSKNFNELSSLNSPSIFQSLREFFEFLTFSNQISLKSDLNEKIKKLVEKLTTNDNTTINHLVKVLSDCIIQE
eukprot:gene10774-3393_t